MSGESPMDVVCRFLRGVAAWDEGREPDADWCEKGPLPSKDVMLQVVTFITQGGVRQLDGHTFLNNRGRTLTVGPEWVTLT